MRETSQSSLCNFCVLCVSVGSYCCELDNHRDTENTEVAQRNLNLPQDCRRLMRLCKQPVPSDFLLILHGDLVLLQFPVGQFVGPRA